MASIRKIMIKYNYNWAVYMLALTLISCSAPTKNVSDATVDMIVNLQCRAINLKNQRFDLSKTLREEEAKANLDTIVIAEIKRKADTLKTQSLDLADILKSKLDSVFVVLKENLVEKENFNRQLEEKVTSSSCTNK